MIRPPFRRPAVAAAAVSLALILAGCGSDSSTSTGSSTTAAGASTTAAAGSSTTKAATATSAAAGSSTTAAAAAAGVPVALDEFNVKMAATIKGGNVTFALSNTGEQRHSLAVAKGESYATLPQLANGAVDTDKLGADFIGKSEVLAGGGTGTVSFNLPAGKYVFFCPIAVGPGSHAKAGQVLSVTVS